MAKSNEGLTVKKENFSEWYSQVIEKAEVVDLRLGIKGFITIRTWGAMIMENMFQMYEHELQRKGHLPVIMPSVIPESNLKKESNHILGFTPQVFWLEAEKGEERLALRPIIRGREFHWIECHDAFATKEEAIEQTHEDMDTTEKIMHQKFGVPFLAMKRPEWDKFLMHD